MISNNKIYRTICERHGVSRQEYYKEFITEYRDKFRPPSILISDMLNTKNKLKPSAMLISNNEPEFRYTFDKDDNQVIKVPDNKTRNEFDESTYTYYSEMVSKKSNISHNILINKICAEYKVRYPRSKPITYDNIKKIVLWTIHNPESILVMVSKMPKYDQIKLIFERLDGMGVLHLFYSDKDLEIIHNLKIKQTDGSIKSVETRTKGKTFKQLFAMNLVKVEYHRMGVIATYQTIDHSDNKYIKSPFPFTYPEDD